MTVKQTKRCPKQVCKIATSHKRTFEYETFTILLMISICWNDCSCALWKLYDDCITHNAVGLFKPVSPVTSCRKWKVRDKPPTGVRRADTSDTLISVQPSAVRWRDLRRHVTTRSWTPEHLWHVPHGERASHWASALTLGPMDQTWSGSESEDAFDFLFKIILIGDSNVGKTCVVQSFKTGLYSERQHNTIGVDFTVRTLHIHGKRVKVHCLYIHSLLMHSLYFTLLCVWWGFSPARVWGEWDCISTSNWTC